MRKYLHIDLASRSVETETLEGPSIVDAGRGFIARTLLEGNIATVDPLSSENPPVRTRVASVPTCVCTGMARPAGIFKRRTVAPSPASSLYSPSGPT